MPRFASGFATVRDLLSFVGGLGLLGHEVFLAPTAEPVLVAAAVALTGVPLALSGTGRNGKP